jgi:hypothetical protein
LLDYAGAGALVGVVTSVEETAALLDAQPDDHAITARVRSRMGHLVVGSQA